MATRTAPRGRGRGEKASGPSVPAGNQQYNVTPERFIEIWQMSESAEEAAKKLGMPKPIAHARASSYRKQGVNLKKMPRRPNRGLNVSALNDLIEKIDRRRKAGESEGRKPAASGDVRETVDAVVKGLTKGGKK